MSVIISDKQAQNINTWAIEIPSIIRATYGTLSTKEEYGEELDDAPWGWGRQVTREQLARPRGYMFRDASASRTSMEEEAHRHADWVGENMTAVSRVFANWLNCNGYDDVIMSADVHEGRCNSPEHYSWFRHNNVIVFKTIGKPRVPDFPDGWCGAPIKITTGVYAGRCAHILIIDKTKARPYTVIIDATPMRYKRSQFKLFSRRQVREIVEGGAFLFEQDTEQDTEQDADLLWHTRHPDTLRTLSQITNLGNIELPAYACSGTTMKCTVWVDPIFSDCGVGRQEYKKLLTSEVGGTEIRRESSTTWQTQKPTKGAKPTKPSVTAKSVVDVAKS